MWLLSCTWFYNLLCHGSLSKSSFLQLTLRLTLGCCSFSTIIFCTPITSIPGLGGSAYNNSCLGHFQMGLCITWGCPWRRFRSSKWYRMQQHKQWQLPFISCIWIPLFCKLHWLSLCFQIQFALFIVIYIARHCAGLLAEPSFSFPWSTYPVRSGRRGGKLWVPSIRKCCLAGFRKSFFCCGTYPLDHHSHEDTTGFCEALKTWLCNQAWGSECVFESISWLC